MKLILTFLLLCLYSISFGKNTTFEKLCMVNKYWMEQSDVPKNIAALEKIANEHALIQLHLRLVEQTLRGRSTANLSAQQATNRTKCLNYLNEYWHAGNFPINDDYAYRTPIFIDKHDNFCAVGYLVKASGHEDVSRMISSKTNLAYVKEMNYPELNTWAAENGFIVDELAWIQPWYGPYHLCDPVGKGVEGEVIELFPDNADGKLYVGGAFNMVDSTLPANNIAYVTESNGVFTWHSMGTGINGTVHAITKYNGRIFVAGHFTMAGDSAATNIAYWDGSSWHSAGCTYGTIYDLEVMNNQLYAAGEFDVCTAMSDINFARWTGSNWQQIPGISGRVNTLYAKDTTLILGGAFSHNNDTPNVIKWSSNAGFTAFNNRIENEVRDIQKFKDTLYAACKRTSIVDTLNLIVKLNNNNWGPLMYDTTHILSYFRPFHSGMTFNTLCVDKNQFLVGGCFSSNIYSGLDDNCFDIGLVSDEWILVDSTINKMVQFKNVLFAGGAFRKGATNYQQFMPIMTPIKGITKRRFYPYTSVSITNTANTFELYPNPIATSSQLTIKNNFNANHYSIRDLAGKTIVEGMLKTTATQQLNVPTLSSSMYLLEILNAKNEKAVKRFMVR